MYNVILAFSSLLVLVFLMFSFNKIRGALGKMEAIINRGIGETVEKIEKTIKDEFARNREESNINAINIREELGNSFRNFDVSVTRHLSEVINFQKGQFESFKISLDDLIKANGDKLEKMDNQVSSKIKEIQLNLAVSSKESRQELANTLKLFEDRFTSSVDGFNLAQSRNFKDLVNRINELLNSVELRLEKMRATIEGKLKEIQEDNSKKLEKMRETVEEKLQDTLQKRIGESFKFVSQHLEAVQKGLGEMRSLASGVGDLKRVLSNVKVRGTWGEIQLGAILEQILTPEQYECNVRIKEGTTERVEYAVKLPGQSSDLHSVVWLPIDSKFPQEDYLKILDASEKGDKEAVKRASLALSRSISKSAEEIRKKYINPPKTTDFAIMFLPTEGLYAEVLRMPGQVERVQREYRVIIAGPTTLSAILNSLRLGFRTLAIEKRASDVWTILAAVKTEFAKFATVLDKVKKQLNTASKTIEETGVRTRAMERKLRDVEELPEKDAQNLLGFTGD